MELKINTEKGLEIINVINKLGLKEKVKDVVIGDEIVRNKKIAVQIKENQYHENVLKLIEKKMTKSEYDSLSTEEQEMFLKENLTKDLIKQGNELNNTKLELSNYIQEYGFDLIYTAIIERFYGNKDLIYKTLASLFNTDIEIIKNQSLNETIKMIKELLECQDLKEVINIFM
ncbi:hypothetical protein [Clostridium thermobutyricum]|uniref:Uncharacterized protein n=1 Tax=Clostridium thermobutyricum DSM 4928 TaxID=1121339 RepID=A0A1V4SXG0_9CLOT|nr:hypothetical protein [Clostridium thermobutyricum]OPX48499.1 hypothetical protein CLTHE_11780 [Clostridium thermobutyricum DSM 4928]